MFGAYNYLVSRTIWDHLTLIDWFYTYPTKLYASNLQQSNLYIFYKTPIFVVHDILKVKVFTFTILFKPDFFRLFLTVWVLKSTFWISYKYFLAWTAVSIWPEVIFLMISLFCLSVNLALRSGLTFFFNRNFFFWS